MRGRKQDQSPNQKSTFENQRYALLPFEFTEQEFSKLCVLALEKGVTVSALVRAAIEHLLKNK